MLKLRTVMVYLVAVLLAQLDIKLERTPAEAAVKRIDRGRPGGGKNFPWYPQDKLKGRAPQVVRSHQPSNEMRLRCLNVQGMP